MCVYAYQVWCTRGWEEHPRIINSLTASKARYEYLRHVRDVFPDLKYIDIRSKKAGGLYSSSDFVRTASYRNVPFARCGMKVEVDGRAGVIVGHNSSANFDVLFTDGENKGLVLNCHPNWMMKYFDEDGKEVLDGKA
jgi:hypothetical protein